MAAAAALAYRDANNPLGRVHAILHMVYGLRLCIFLFLREMTVPRFKEVKEKIEKQSPPTRLERLPFILQCAGLYYFMSLPLYITSQAPRISAAGDALARCALVTAALGLGLQISGDFQKSLVKRNNPDKLVTGGFYSIFRHPNYMGELILWTMSSITSLIVASQLPRSWRLLLLSLGSILGNAGIAFILALAATGLEKRQKEKYGNREEYQAWVKRTSAGLLLPRTKPAAQEYNRVQEGL